MHKFLVVLSLIISTALAAQQSDAGSKVALADNQEMTTIYLADQAARDHPATIDWKVLWSADKARRGKHRRCLMLVDWAAPTIFTMPPTYFSMGRMRRIV